MVHLKVAIFATLIATALARAVTFEDAPVTTDLQKRAELAPRFVNPAKVERLRQRLGPQPVEEEEEEDEEAEEEEEEYIPEPEPPKQKKKPKATTRRPTPAPKKGKKSMKKQPPMEEDTRSESRLEPRRRGKKRPKGPKTHLDTIVEEPESEDEINQAPPSTKKHSDNGGGARGNRGKTAAPPKGKKSQPKMKPGPSMFQNKRMEKLSGAPVDEDGKPAPERANIPIPRRNPMEAPNVVQGRPKDRNDGSRARKKKMKASEDGEMTGSERTAKSALEDKGGPKDKPGPSRPKENNQKQQNTPVSHRQATAKRPPPPARSDAESKAVADRPDRPDEVQDADEDYFTWFRSSDTRPVDHAYRNRDSWMNKYAGSEGKQAKQAPPAKKAAPIPPLPPAQGLEKLPMNQRAREREHREKQEAADRQAKREGNKKASRREGF